MDYSFTVVFGTIDLSGNISDIQDLSGNISDIQDLSGNISSNTTYSGEISGWIDEPPLPEEPFIYDT